MAAAKKKSALDGWATLGRRTTHSVRWLLFRAEGRLTLAGLGLLAVLTVGPYVVWQRVSPQLLAGPDYRLSPERVALVPSPESVGWIRRDVRLEALRDAGLDGGVSILDKELCRRVADAFRLHPWIAHVGSVTKHYPAGVQVIVEYRRPAAVVVVATDDWRVVDSEGVVLPPDFTPADARRYPQITGIPAGPFGPTGTRWGDARVDEAAKIAAALANDWQRLGLARITPLIVGTGDEGDEDYAFALFTERGRRVYWGRGPDHKHSGEPTTQQKAERLRQYAGPNGSLDAGAANAGQDLDVRGPEIVPVPTAAKGGAARQVR